MRSSIKTFIVVNVIKIAFKDVIIFGKERKKERKTERENSKVIV